MRYEPRNFLIGCRMEDLTDEAQAVLRLLRETIIYVNSDVPVVEHPGMYAMLLWLEQGGLVEGRQDYQMPWEYDGKAHYRFNLTTLGKAVSAPPIDES